jgi:DNA mismatch repair protein MSH6
MGIPDLDRMITRIHAGTARLKPLLDTVVGFDRVARVRAAIDGRLGAGCPAIPDIEPLLADFRAGFDWAVARSEGMLVPTPGSVPEYDAAAEALQVIEAQLEAELFSARRYFAADKVEFKHIGKEVYQISVPAAALKRRKPPPDWRVLRANKSFTNYWPPAVAALVPNAQRTREARDDALADVLRVFLAKFDANFTVWSAAVRAAAETDCLYSLAVAGLDASAAGGSCFPTILDDTDPATGEPTSVLDLTEMRHPCAPSGEDFVPNDTRICVPGVQPHAALLVTGPNMGGKSTLLRQVCVAVVLAQLGACVPAASMTLSPCDRVFTRLGASDRINSGLSTFMVELQETATVLRDATRRSLVILDELGRGTSTFDGHAIAGAVLADLVNRVGCRTLFSTHYHLLAGEALRAGGVAMFMMESMVTGQEAEPKLNKPSSSASAGDDGDDAMATAAEATSASASASYPEVTFLYKFIPGVENKSMGINVARLAGLPQSIVAAAETKAEEFEARMRAQVEHQTLSAFAKIWAAGAAE